jgi:hypothetical protein
MRMALVNQHDRGNCDGLTTNNCQLSQHQASSYFSSYFTREEVVLCLAPWSQVSSYILPYFRYGEVFLCLSPWITNKQGTQIFTKLSSLNKNLKVEREVSLHVQVYGLMSISLWTALPHSIKLPEHGDGYYYYFTLLSCN